MNVRQLGLPKFAFDNFDISSHTDIHRCRFICNFNDMVFVINLLAKIQSKVCTVYTVCICSIQSMSFIF